MNSNRAETSKWLSLVLGMICLHLRTPSILNAGAISPSAVTLADDLRTAFAMEFDNMIAVLKFRDCHYTRSSS